jgi:hypothetical protein
MIQLTRLNNHPLIVNSDLIKFVERAPDTVLTLVSGEKDRCPRDLRTGSMPNSEIRLAIPAPETATLKSLVCVMAHSAM